MTHLERVSVEGFKGIDRLDFEPGALNVITGRNNSGKTSLLEAIDLAVDPSNIERFGGNLDKLVNTRHEHSAILVEMADDLNNVELTAPTEEKVPEYLLEILRDEMYDNWEFLSSQSDAHPDPVESDVTEIIDRQLPDAITTSLSEDHANDVRKEILVFRVNGETYPYVSFGPILRDFRMQCYDKIEQSLSENFGDDTVNDTRSPVTNTITAVQVFGSLKDDQFVYSSPENISEIVFIDFMQLSKTLDLSGEDPDPVKIDNIGDFIQEKGILNDLKTFDLDHLIFEPDDGEKYSIPFEFMGEGFKTIVGVLWELLDDQPADVVLLEEPETHMHPGYIRELIYFLIGLAREDEIQLFITTHNNDFLNDFFTENLTDEEEAFLAEEFRLTLLQDGAADTMSYREAESQLKDLKLDLRGL